MEGLGPTLLLALVAALALGALAHRLGLPLMIGYIVAGLVVGPATPGPTANREEILALADIGVALLMFSIGLQFSIGEIRSVGARILLGTPIQVAITMGLGTGTGLLLGWSLPEALFIGGAVSVCSTGATLWPPAGKRMTVALRPSRCSRNISRPSTRGYQAALRWRR